MKFSDLEGLQKQLFCVAIHVDFSVVIHIHALITSCNCKWNAGNYNWNIYIQSFNWKLEMRFQYLQIVILCYCLCRILVTTKFMQQTFLWLLNKLLLIILWKCFLHVPKKLILNLYCIEMRAIAYSTVFSVTMQSMELFAKILCDGIQYKTQNIKMHMSLVDWTGE